MTNLPMTVWLVKHLRDIGSGKPETDVELFTTELTARKYITERITYPGSDWLPGVDAEDAAYLAAQEGEAGLVYVWHSEDAEEFFEVEERPVQG